MAARRSFIVGLTLATLVGAAPLLAACSSDGAASPEPGANVPIAPVALTARSFTYSLSEGTAALPLWTTPATRRLTTADRAPGGKARSGLSVSAARNEFEPVQLLLGPVATSMRVEVAKFPQLGAGQRVELAQAGYQAGWQKTLTPLSSGDTLKLDAGQATGLWLTIYVPPGAPAGTHKTTLKLTPEGGATIAVPVTLQVYDFELPSEIHFSSQINLDVASLAGKTVDAKKSLLFEHRLTPASSTWPSGFSWNITWDNSASPQRCKSFYDEPNEAPEYSIGKLGPRYLLGTGWNGVGFPDSELFQFVDNSTPRPDTFCGIARGDHLGSAEYNAAWSKWLTQLGSYLDDHGLTKRAYYYVQNEPQNAADHKLAAHLCRSTRAAALQLRIAISEEPKPEIAEDPGGACGYDIWIAHVRAYQQDYAWKRQREQSEQVWFYSLDQDPAPYFNPTSNEGTGLNARIIPWTAWAHRVRGWAYYDGGRFFAAGQPGVTAELLREGFEDYEYLYLANGKAHPQVDVTGPIDATARSVAAGMTSWTKDPDALMTLRHELGLYLEGSRKTLPVLEVASSRPRAAYYINFQDPKGPPSASPLVVDGKTWMKVGWGPFDAKLGYGWVGEFTADPAIALYGYDDGAGASELERSYLYDDYGRDNLFEFSLAPGRYKVTVGVGRPGRGYANDPQNLSIEGQRVIDDEPTSDAAPRLERSITLDITDGSLSMLVGGRSAKTGDYSYTFLAYLAIEPTK